MVGFYDLSDDVLIYLLGIILQADEIAPCTPEFFFPPSVWSYIQHLTIEDCCVERETLHSPEVVLISTPSYNPHIYVCRVFLGPVIQHILQQMPSLTKLSLYNDLRVVHGPSSTFLRFALSLPRLREFEMTGLTFCPVVLPDESLEPEGGTQWAPLTTFCYEAILTRDRKYALSVEKDALSLVLTKIHHSLATLVLPSEPAPIALMSGIDWPNLRELKLRGMRWPEPRTPLVILFATMPRLRTLVLELRIPDDGDPEAIWPPGLPRNTMFPWPELEELTVANPHPADELFAHLLPGLRSLSLPSCPRKCVEEWLWTFERRYSWFPHTFYLPKTSDLPRLLERCSAAGLTHLEIEYGADERKSDLLRYLASAFTGLCSLTLYRYLESDETAVCAEDVVRPLATLKCLQTFSLHPDLETRPERISVGWMGSGGRIYDPDTLERFLEILEGAALRIARTLNESLERVSLWMPSNRDGPVSANFSVIRDGPEKDGGLRIQREPVTHHVREDVWGI